MAQAFVTGDLYPTYSFRCPFKFVSTSASYYGHVNCYPSLLVFNHSPNSLYATTRNWEMPQVTTLDCQYNIRPSLGYTHQILEILLRMMTKLAHIPVGGMRDGTDATADGLNHPDILSWRCMYSCAATVRTRSRGTACLAPYLFVVKLQCDLEIMQQWIRADMPLEQHRIYRPLIRYLRRVCLYKKFWSGSHGYVDTSGFDSDLPTRSSSAHSPDKQDTIGEII